MEGTPRVRLAEASLKPLRSRPDPSRPNESARRRPTATGRTPRTDGQDSEQVVPPTLDACFDHVRRQIIGSPVDRRHLSCSRHTPTLRRQTRTEHVRHQAQLRLLADRAGDAAFRSDIARRPNQFGVRIADFVLTETTASELVDEMSARQTVVDHASRSAKRASGKPARSAMRRHGCPGYRARVIAQPRRRRPVAPNADARSDGLHRTHSCHDQYLVRRRRRRRQRAPTHR